MRCSIGRHREEQVLQVDDDELVRVALADLADAIGLSVAPVDSHVQRWGGALPAVRRRATSTGWPRCGASWPGLPGLAVCGSAYDGVGIPACVASAELAVDEGAWT